VNVLGLIPARGGSKGVPRKNLRLLAGKSLLEYTVSAALASERLARVVLSTDDEEIASVGRRLGVETPFVRPAQLALDETPMLPVVLHAVEWFRQRGQSFDAVCLLQPTSPLRLPADIDGAVDLLENTGADSVVSFVRVGGWHPARMKYVRSDGRVVDPPFKEQLEGQRRQELPALYLRAGSIYLTRTPVLTEQGSFQGRDCRALIIPEERACNIDTEYDFMVAECLVERHRIG
jgi:CMP-N-acetylneuraminic acid synthetase